MSRSHIIVYIVLTSLSATPVSAEVLFHDDFNGGTLDLTQWVIPEGEGTFVGRTQFRDNAHTDPLTVSEGTAKLPLETHNPTALTPGDSFYGTEIHTKAAFERGTGLTIEARVRVVDTAGHPLSRGIVNAFFLFKRRPGAEPIWDETDFELLTNDIDDLNHGNENSRRVLTNVFDDFHLNNPSLNPDTPSSVTLPTGVDLTEFNTFQVRWLADRVQWHVLASGQMVLLRTETGVVPDEPMNVRFNINAPDAGFDSAFDGGLQPAANPAGNEVFFFEVDYLTVTSIPEPASLLLLLGAVPWFTRRGC